MARCSPWIRYPRISNLPLIASYVEDKDDVKRLNHIGTHPVHILIYLNAINYLNWIELKEKKKTEISKYWTSALRNKSNIILIIY